MNSIFKLVEPAARQVIIYGQKLLQDIQPEQFARKPQRAGEIIDINHPAFQYGHLSLYPERIAGVINLPMEKLKAPEGFWDLFKIGTPCVDDVSGSHYPRMQTITEHFFASHEALFECLRKVPDEVFNRVNVDDRSKERFPLVGSFIIYLLGPHANTHFGQVSAWRRCMGLKALA